MINRQEAFFMEERELLGLANGQWITSLEFAFQVCMFKWVGHS